MPSSAGRGYEENEKFGWRFFPRPLARAPDPIRVTRAKAPGSCRVFVFGESAALGDPEPAYGFSRILRELLEARCPGTKFEVVNTAMTAINSHAILPIACDCAAFESDIWIIYMGNNEVVGPFGAGSVFGAKAPPLGVVRAGLAAKCTALGQSLYAFWQLYTGQSQTPTHWEGMKMMLNERIGANDPVLKRVYSHFSRNLEDILNAAREAGVQTIVCSMASNLKDGSPFASLNRPGLATPLKAKWDSLFSSGAEAESRKDYTNALARYGEAAETDGTYAELAFRMGRCYQALGQTAAARDQYARARDLDALRFRADTEINRLIRNVCSRRVAENVHLFDPELVLTNICGQGIPGEECFYDHVHFNFAGNYWLARGLADQVIALLPQSMRGAAERGEILTEEQCAERLAFTDWDTHLVLEEMQRRLSEAPFTAQLDHQAAIQRGFGAAAGLERKLDKQGMAKAAAVYGTALERRPEDWRLHDRLAALLEASGDLTGAARHWAFVMDAVPEWVEACYKLGDISAREGKPIEAELYYRRVLSIRPTSSEAMNGLGLLVMDEGKLDQAQGLFEKALNVNPKFAQAHINLGVLQSRQGKSEAAEAHFREALQCDPDSAAAHVNLGNLLASRQKQLDAIMQYREALRIRANQAAVHFALANSLAAVGNGREAVAEYQEAIRLDPNLAEAHFNLGVALAKSGDLQAASASFQEACRLSPNDPQAHLNFGVALAQQNRLNEAIAQFQVVLRLDPANGPASQYLRVASAKQNQAP